MSSEGGKPRQVAALEKQGLEVLSWGGDNAAGVVEWRSYEDVKLDAAHQRGAIRNCRRWAVVGQMELGDHHLMPESQIELAKFDIWGEEMRSSALKFRDAVRRAAPPRMRRKGIR